MSLHIEFGHLINRKWYLCHCRQTQEIGQAVVEMVKQGAADGRLVCGLDGCVQVLNR